MMENLEKSFKNNKISSNIYMDDKKAKIIEKINIIKKALIYSFKDGEELSKYQIYQIKLIDDLINNKNTTVEQLKSKLETLKKDITREMEMKKQADKKSEERKSTLKMLTEAEGYDVKYLNEDIEYVNKKNKLLTQYYPQKKGNMNLSQKEEDALIKKEIQQKSQKVKKFTYMDSVRTAIKYLETRDPKYFTFIEKLSDKEKAELKHKLIKEHRLNDLNKIKKSANVKRLLKPVEKQPKRKTWKKTITHEDIVNANNFMILRDEKQRKKEVISGKKLHKLYKKNKLIKEQRKLKLIVVFEYTDPQGKKEEREETVGIYDINEYTNIDNLLQHKEEQFRRKHIHGKEDSTHYYSENIKKIKSFYHIKSAVRKINKNQIDIKMTNENVMRRDWLKYSKSIDKDSYNDMGNKCVYKLLVKFLKPVWTKVDEKKLFEYFKENCKEEFEINEDEEDERKFQEKLRQEKLNKSLSVNSDEIKITYHHPISYDDEDNEDDEDEYKITSYYPVSYDDEDNDEEEEENEQKEYVDKIIPFEERGISTRMIGKLCLDKNITMYAMNQDDNCIYNNKQELIDAGKKPENSAYHPLCFYSIDKHMYLLNNIYGAFKSIGETQKKKKNVITLSTAMEFDVKKEDDDNFIKDRIMIENIKFEDATELKDCIIFMKQSDLKKDIVKYIKNTKNIPSMKIENNKIIKMEIKEKNLTIVCENSNVINHNQILEICKNSKIPFKNQSVGTLVKNLENDFFKPSRLHLTKEQKEMLSKDGCNKCKLMYLGYQYDHIIPLSVCGDNSISNFQALCEECHLEKTKRENDCGLYFKNDNNISSSFNDMGLNIIKSYLSKHWAVVDNLQYKRNLNNKIYKIDHIGCRRNILSYSKYDYPQYTVMDDPKEYSGEKINCGMYYIECNLYVSGLRGNGWYSHVIIKRCLEKKLINQDMIKYEFIPSYTISGTHFKSFIEHIKKVCSEEDKKIIESNIKDGTKKPLLSKTCINSYVGMQAIMKSEFHSTRFTKSTEEASARMTEDNIFVQNWKISKDITLYEMTETIKILTDDIYLPIYNQILAIEACNLYDLEEFIIENNGIVIDRNTDSILYEGIELDISKFFWDDEKKNEKYRYEKPTLLKCRSVCDIIRDEKYIMPKIEYNIINEIKNDVYFENLIDEVYKSKQGCLIKALSGCGKTEFMKRFIKKLENENIIIDKVAPSNKSARLITGRTIHKMATELKISNLKERLLVKKLENVKYIFVDEYGMLSSEFYRLLLFIKRYVPEICIIVAGDITQLAPVGDRYHGEYDTSALHYIVDGNKMEFKTCHRSDKRLFNLYTNLDNINIDDFRPKEKTQLNICYIHTTRKRINQEMNILFSKNKEVIKVEKNEKKKNTQEGMIYEGCPIVAFENKKTILNKKVWICNSDDYIIKKIDIVKETFTITFINENDEDEDIDIPANLFNTMFYFGYARTVHSLQGSTLNENYTIFDWCHRGFDDRLKYVSLSRAKTITQINIMP